MPPKADTLRPIATPAQTRRCVIKMAAAIAGMHPHLIDGCSESVNQEAPRIVGRWAETLPDDLMLTFSCSSDIASDSDELMLMADEKQGTFLRPAFERANEIRAGLGWQLIAALQCLSFSYGLVLTPMSLFDLCSSRNWCGAVTQKEFVEMYRDNGDEGMDESELESIGPAAFFDDFPGMPSDLVNHQNKASRRMKDAETYWHMAGRAKSEWECELLLALAAVSDFRAAKKTTVWDVMGNASMDYEHGMASYWFSWDKADNMDRCADEVMNDLWNDGIAGDALLMFPFGDADVQDVQSVVECVEACGDHRMVMDLVLAVVRNAEKSNAS